MHAGVWWVNQMDEHGMILKKKMDLKKIQLDGVDWICLAQNSDKLREFMNTAMNLHIQQNVGDFLTS